MLVVVESHPVQYHAPLYRALQDTFRIPVTAVYGSDAGVAEYRDQEFGVTLSWDTDLLRGYESHFLRRTSGGLSTVDQLHAREISRRLAQLRPRAVLLLGYGSRFDRLACLEAWRTGVPLLFRGETTDHAVARGPARSWLRDTALRILYRRFSKVLFIGKNSERHHRRLGVPPEKLVFSPYCVDTEAFSCGEDDRDAVRDSVRSQLGAGESDVVLLCVGKISARKGPDVLLQAVKQLPTSLCERVLVCFVGDGDMRGSLQAASADRPTVRTVFAGFRNQSQLSSYYHAADALVMASRWGETWGLVVNEALHHGVPCVVSDAVGCAPDLIEEGTTGEICEAGSADSLASAVGRVLALLNDTDVRRRCRERVSHYCVSEAARGVAEAYRQVTESPTRASAV